MEYSASILITGASGFVGGRIIKALEDKFRLLTPSHADHIRNISISMKKAYEASGGKIRFKTTLEGLEDYLKNQGS